MKYSECPKDIREKALEVFKAIGTTSGGLAQIEIIAEALMEERSKCDEQNRTLFRSSKTTCRR